MDDDARTDNGTDGQTKDDNGDDIATTGRTRRDGTDAQRTDDGTDVQRDGRTRRGGQTIIYIYIYIYICIRMSNYIDYGKAFRETHSKNSPDSRIYKSNSWRWN